MIYCKNVAYSYHGSHEGLLDFSIDVCTEDDGRVYGLLGKNGSGKTTLIRLLTGVLMPQKGTVKVHNFESKRRNPHMLREIAIIPEEYEVPPITPKTYERCWSKFYPRFDNKLFAHLQEVLGCPQNKLLENFSMGQKKKFLFAFAIATQAKLLIFDEPTNSRDISGKILFKQIIHKHTTKEQRILISTHQIKDIKDIIDSVIVIDRGNYLLHSRIDTINKAFMAAKTKEAMREQVIYHIPYLDGYMSLIKRTSEDEPTAVDLELFFLAAIENTQSVREILQPYSKDFEAGGNI